MSLYFIMCVLCIRNNSRIIHVLDILHILLHNIFYIYILYTLLIYFYSLYFNDWLMIWLFFVSFLICNQFYISTASSMTIFLFNLLLNNTIESCIMDDLHETKLNLIFKLRLFSKHSIQRKSNLIQVSRYWCSQTRTLNKFYPYT